MSELFTASNYSRNDIFLRLLGGRVPNWDEDLNDYNVVDEYVPYLQKIKDSHSLKPLHIVQNPGKECYMPREDWQSQLPGRLVQVSFMMGYMEHVGLLVMSIAKIVILK